jgi:hypothetical protein
VTEDDEIASLMERVDHVWIDEIHNRQNGEAVRAAIKRVLKNDFTGQHSQHDRRASAIKLLKDAVRELRFVETGRRARPYMGYVWICFEAFIEGHAKSLDEAFGVSAPTRTVVKERHDDAISAYETCRRESSYSRMVDEVKAAMASDRSFDYEQFRQSPTPDAELFKAEVAALNAYYRDDPEWLKVSNRFETVCGSLDLGNLLRFTCFTWVYAVRQQFARCIPLVASILEPYVGIHPNRQQLLLSQDAILEAPVSLPCWGDKKEEPTPVKQLDWLVTRLRVLDGGVG